jgi:hypothetical protein
MSSLISFLNKQIFIIPFLLVLCACPGITTCAHATTLGKTAISIAVLPVYNISNAQAPLKEIRQFFIDMLTGAGITVLPEEDLEKFMVQHRIRQVGGVSREISRGLQEEAGVDAVLITTLAHYDEIYPPKIVIFARLVSTGEKAFILWAEDTGMAGDDSPGILGLGLIHTADELLSTELDALWTSLAGYLRGMEVPVKKIREMDKFRPKSFYRSSLLDEKNEYSVAVAPFFNESLNKHAGQIMALHYVNHLSKLKKYAVVEPGWVHDEFLKLRVIMDKGISLAQADNLLATLDADLILGGIVLDYQDYQGAVGTPKVDFSTILLERESRETVWNSYSWNTGDESVIFFDWGRVNTAHAMASQMTGFVINMIASGPKE